MSNPKHILVAGRALPLDLSTLFDYEEGGEAFALPLVPVRFDFSYMDVPFICFCEEKESVAPRLLLSGDIGPLPYSAESRDGRIAIQTILDVANDALGDRFRLANGRIQMEVERTLPQPLTATALVGGIAEVLIPARPYLGLVAEVVRPPLQSPVPGEGAVRPGWRYRPLVMARSR
jgi:hypothetical protein